MNAVKDNVEILSAYLNTDFDFDFYFGWQNSQIVEDENGTEVLSEIADEYIKGKVVCTVKEGRDMFDTIRNKVLADILQDIVFSSDGFEQLHEEDFEEDENYSTDTFSIAVRTESDEIDVIQLVPKNKRLKLIYSQVWDGGNSDEYGISLELYNFAIYDLGLLDKDLPLLLGCTHVFITEGGDIYGFIEQK